MGREGEWGGGGGGRGGERERGGEGVMGWVGGGRRLDITAVTT